MSTSAYWMPNIPPKVKSLPSAIKYALAKRYQDHDGSLSGTTYMSHSHLPYLEGLRDAAPSGSDVERGATALIDAINKYGEIIFIIE